MGGGESVWLSAVVGRQGFLVVGELEQHDQFMHDNARNYKYVILIMVNSFVQASGQSSNPTDTQPNIDETAGVSFLNLAAGT